jgi:hypothetical protein
LTFLRNLIRSSSFSSPHSAWYFLTSIYLLDILVLESNRPDRLQFWLFRFSGVRLLGTLAYSELCYAKNVWNVSWSAQERSRTLKNNRTTTRYAVDLERSLAMNCFQIGLPRSLDDMLHPPFLFDQESPPRFPIFIRSFTLNPNKILV